MAEVKVTKRDYFGMIKEIVGNSEVENKEDIIAFVDKQVEQLENKAAKARERAAKNKEKSDAMREAVYAVLTNEYQSIDAITAQVEGEEITRNKVVARLTRLVDDGMAVKDSVKVEGASRKIMCYKLADAVDEESAE